MAVTYETIERSISEATIGKTRQSGSREILLVQDTCGVSCGARTGIEGMGHSCDSDKKGMRPHSRAAVTDEGLPLGLLFQSVSTRQARRVNGKKEAANRGEGEFPVDQHPARGA